MWPFGVKTISILPLNVFVFSQCRWKGWSPGCYEEGEHWEWGFPFRKVCSWCHWRKKQNKTKLKKTFDPPQLETRNPSFYSSYIHIRAEKVKDDSISTLGHPMHWVARSDKLHLWAHWCGVLSIGSGLTVAAHLTRLGWTQNQGQKAWISTTDIPTLPISPSVKRENQLLAYEHHSQMAYKLKNGNRQVSGNLSLDNHKLKSQRLFPFCLCPNFLGMLE